MRLVLTKDNIVVNIFEVDDSEVQNVKDSWTVNEFNVVESDTALVGWKYENGQFTPPEVSQEIPLPKYITRLAFRNRFTSAEKINIELAALDNPAATAQQRQNAALIRVFLKDLDAATFIDLNRQETKDSVETLETIGLIASGRANEILTAEITAQERYRG